MKKIRVSDTELLTGGISADTTTLQCQQGQALVGDTKTTLHSILQSAGVVVIRRSWQGKKTSTLCGDRHRPSFHL
jgi:hypothetical protein